VNSTCPPVNHIAIPAMIVEVANVTTQELKCKTTSTPFTKPIAARTSLPAPSSTVDARELALEKCYFIIIGARVSAQRGPQNGRQHYRETRRA
jgi:hypothetical protein